MDAAGGIGSMKIKRFIDCAIPIDTCNLRCHYCYITQKKMFDNALTPYPRSPEEIRKAFSKEKLGGICLINLCASGETMLSNELVPTVKALAQEGHYIMIVSNGTVTKRFREIAELDESVRSHLFIKFSLHYLEMVRLNMLDKFADNVRLMKASKVSFTVEITPSDELIPHIDDLKKYCLDHFGALCHVTIPRNEKQHSFDLLSAHSFEDFKHYWNDFHSELFDVKCQLFGQKRREFCYAGDWSLFVNLFTGDYTQCVHGKRIGNIYEDETIKTDAVGTHCPSAYCFNGHAFLTMGDIPEFNITTFAEVRNRVCEDGTEWLQDDFKQALSSRLYNSNKEYSFLKKSRCTAKYYEPILKYKLVRILKNRP